MKDELQDKLRETYPEIFAKGNYRASDKFEIECNDGWYGIIYSVCDSITRHVKSHNKLIDQYDTMTARKEAGEELMPWSEQLISKPRPEPMEFPTAAQIKEKFGSMRFYIDGGDIEVNAMIDVAETMSDTTCEVCGTTANVGKVSNGWVKTLCKECGKQHESRE